MNLQPWAQRARMRLAAMLDELETPGTDRDQVLGVCIVALHENDDGERYSSVSGSLGPCCSANDMAAALLAESDAMSLGEGVRSVDRELSN